MGCCASSSRVADDDSHNGQANRITPLSPPNTQQRSRQIGLGGAYHNTHNNALAPASRSGTQASSQNSNPNRPLLAPPPSSQIEIPLAYKRSQQPLTRSLLSREREAFFDTRVSGQPEIWNALRLVCESLEGGDTAQAQAIVDALGCNCPTGEVWEVEGSKSRNKGRPRGGIFDEQGERYAVPAWVIGIPADILSEEVSTVGATRSIDGEFDQDEKDKSSVGSRRDADRDRGTPFDETSQHHRLLEKGKGRATHESDRNATTQPDSNTTENINPSTYNSNSVNTENGVSPTSPPIKVRARLSHNAQDVIMNLASEDPVSILIDGIKEKAQLKTDARVKIFYFGKVLKTEETLTQQGWQEGHILNVYVFDPA